MGKQTHLRLYAADEFGQEVLYESANKAPH